MKLALVVTGLVAACGATTRPEHLKLTFAADAGGQKLAHASQSGDIQTIRQLLGPKVVVGGLWFPDVDCTREFAAPGEVGGGRLDELARCLTTVKLQLSDHHAMFDDVAVLSYAPGIEIEARLIDSDHGTWLSWIGYADVREASDRLPTLTQQAFEALRDDTSPPPVLQGHEAAWLRVCIDASGHVTNAHVRMATSMAAAHAFAAVAQSWHFHPFMPAGQPLPACALVPMTAGMKVPARPPTLATPNGEPMLYVRAHRISESHFDMSPSTREMRAQNIHTAVTIIRICVNERGEPYDARLLRASGVPSVDRIRLQAAEQARYEAFRDGDRPIAACSIEVSELSVD